MYTAPQITKPETFQDERDNQTQVIIDEYDKRILNYLGRLYKGMTGETMDFETIGNAIDALQQYNASSEYKYLENLLYPEKQKGIKIPSPIPVPSCSFQLHNSVTLSTNSLGNLCIVFNPFFLYNSNGLKSVLTTGPNSTTIVASVTPDYMSSFFVNNSENLVGNVASTSYKDWVPINIGQGIPNVYDQYRLVSGSIVVKYIGRLDSTSGVIGGAIVFDESRNVGWRGKLTQEVTDSPAGGTGNWIRKYANFDLAMDSFYHQENLCLEGMRELYFPIDNTFEEYMKTLSTDYCTCNMESEDFLSCNMSADQDYYKSGFNQMIYVLGAPQKQACFKVDVYLNFECLPNAEFLNYMPITPNNVCIDPYYKKQAIAETQRNSIGKATETAKGNEGKPSIWKKLKEKLGNSLPGIGKLIAKGLITAIPGLKPGLALAGSLLESAKMVTDE